MRVAPIPILPSIYCTRTSPASLPGTRQRKHGRRGDTVTRLAACISVALLQGSATTYGCSCILYGVLHHLKISVPTMEYCIQPFKLHVLRKVSWRLMTNGIYVSTK